jgi:hypothetical protein
MWYIRRKTCTYLEPRLIRSPNRSKHKILWNFNPYVESSAGYSNFYWERLASGRPRLLCLVSRIRVPPAPTLLPAPVFGLLAPAPLPTPFEWLGLSLFHTGASSASSTPLRAQLFHTARMTPPPLLHRRCVAYASSPHRRCHGSHASLSSSLNNPRSRSTFATLRWNNCNIRLEQIKYLKHTFAK